MASTDISICMNVAMRLGVENFAAAPDELKFQVYKITISEIFYILLNEDLQYIPYETIMKIKEAFIEIIRFFYYIRSNELGENFDINVIISQMENANTYILSASYILEVGKRKRTISFFRQIQTCRNYLYSIIELFDSF